MSTALAIIAGIGLGGFLGALAEHRLADAEESAGGEQIRAARRRLLETTARLVLLTLDDHAQRKAG